MKLLLQSEEFLQLALGVFGLYLQTNFQSIHIAWWLWPFLFLSPDISMIAYFINTKVGAFAYNLVHHKGIAIIIAAIGFYTSSNAAQFIGILLFTHSSFDRTMGYGLKYEDDFKHTHLGWIGKQGLEP